MPGADPEPAEDVDEQGQVELSRYHEAIEAGFDHFEACRFAVSEEDVGVLRKLVRSGCPVRLRARIVL